MTSSSIRDSVGLAIEATVGGRSYRSKGVGECTHTPHASIYGVPAAQTRASYASDGELEHLNLTLWQLNSGGTLQFGLHIRAGSQDHQIMTVQGGTLSGSGTASIRREGSRGTLTVEGRDVGGADLRVVVQCERFSEPVAEGG